MDNMRNYEDLANAIVVQACKDYKETLERHQKRKQKVYENFFNSEWFGILTDIDPEWLMNKIKSEIEAERIF